MQQMVLYFCQTTVNIYTFCAYIVMWVHMQNVERQNVECQNVNNNKMSTLQNVESQNVDVYKKLNKLI
jgi:hypothetical protein